MQNRVMNVTMDKAKKIALAHFTEVETWILLRTINTPMVEPQNESRVNRVPTVPDEIGVQVP